MKIKFTVLKLGLLLACILTGMNAMAQDQRISGKVSDENGSGLPGVSIVIKGTAKGTTTDTDGNFALNASPDDVITISFVGYATEELVVGNKTVFEISLTPDIQSLDEIVVVGYGTQKKSDLVSSVASVKTESLLKVPSTDIGEMMRGKTAGVLVTTSDAGPGGSTSLLLRGQRSLAAANSPIYIIDGVQMGGLNDVNPNDIESMEILKDAAAQSIYGARASNGVVLITTKRGKAGETKVSYNGYYGVQNINRTFDVYSPLEFAQMKREAYRADNNDVFQPDGDIFTPIEYEVLQSGEFVDWEDKLIKSAGISSHNMSFSTGTKNTQIYVGLNYNSQQGVVPGTDFTRGNLRLNADQKISEWLKIGLSTSWQLSNRNNPGTGGTLQRSITTSPLAKIYEEDGKTYRLYPTGVAESQNPLLDIEEVSNLQDDRNDIINLYLDVTPFKGFKYKLNLGRRSWNRKVTNYNSSKSLAGIRNFNSGSGFIQFLDNYQATLENIITYDFDAAPKHHVNLTGVHGVIKEVYNSFTNNSTGIPMDILDIYGLESAGVNTPAVDGNERTLVSFAGRVQYDFSGKYFFNASMRADGSSTHGANNKWGYFPSVGVSWNAHKEGFMSSVGSISTLKFRATYGSVGNPSLDPYRSQVPADQRDYIFNGQKGVGFIAGSRLSNPDLKWETSTTLNLALDFGVLQERISGTVEWYNTSTTDLLAYRTVQVIGYSDQLSNIGEVQNRGIEVTLNGVVVEKDDLVINAGITFTKNNNKILSLFGDLDGDGKEDDVVGNRWFIGQPIDVHYQYKPAGIFQSADEIASSMQPTQKVGSVKLMDKDGNGILNGDDRYITPAAPKWFGSFNADAKYKSFDISVSVYAVHGVIRNNPFLYGYNEGGSLRGIYNGVKQDYWTPENTSGNWPRPRESNDPDFIWTMGLQDASYVRLQNVTLGYSLPKALLDKLKMNKVRVYVTGQNLITSTDFQSYSPEKNPNEYPEARTVLGGLQIDF